MTATHRTCPECHGEGEIPTNRERAAQFGKLAATAFLAFLIPTGFMYWMGLAGFALMRIPAYGLDQCLAPTGYGGCRLHETAWTYSPQGHAHLVLILLTAAGAVAGLYAAWRVYVAGWKRWGGQ